MFSNLSDFKKGLYLNIGIIAGVFAVFIAFFILLRLNISHQSGVANDIRSKRDYVAQSINNLASLAKDAPTARDYATKLSTLVPTHDYLISSFSSDIKAIALKDGVSLSFVFGTESSVMTGKLGSIAFSSTIDGPLDPILGFIKDIESRYYAIKINTIDISRASGSASRMSASGQVFFQSK